MYLVVVYYIYIYVCVFFFFYVLTFECLFLFSNLWTISILLVYIFKSQLFYLNSL